MGVKFFGQFLLEQRAITNEQLLRTIQLQDSRNRPLGAIAIEKGYLTAAQAADLNQRQQATDRRFGDLARELGMMTAAQVDEVVAAQAARRVRIGEALVELGFLTPAEVETQLAAFGRDQAPYETARVQLPEGTPNPQFVSTCIDLTEKLLLRAAGLFGKRGVVVPCNPEGPPTALVSVRIPFISGVRASYVTSASRDVAFAITRRMLGSQVTLCDDLAADALREFANVVCGNICASLGKAGCPIEIGPPDEEVRPSTKLGDGVLVPIHMPDGRFELRLHFTPP